MRIHFIPMLVFLASVFPSVATGEMPPESEQEIAPSLAAGKLDGLWSELADPDAGKAYRAIWALTKTPKESVAAIGQQLKPAVAPDPRKVERLIEDLNSETFAVREKANLELTILGGLAESALRKALKVNPALETRQRLEKLVNRLLAPITLPDHLRGIRALETLEYIGTSEAKMQLTKYATGAPGSRLTQDAKEALKRLEKSIPFTPQREPSQTDLYGDPLPVHAVGRLGTIRFRRTWGWSPAPDGLAFLPDGKAILDANDDDHYVRIWEVPSGRLLHKISTGSLHMRGFAMARDGKQFAVGGFHPLVGNEPGAREIQVFTVPSGNLMKTFPRKSVSDHWELAFSPDGKVLFSLDGSEGILRIEEIASGKELTQKQFPSGDQCCMALSKHGDYLAVAYGYRLRKLFLWKWQGEEPREIETPKRGLNSISFSPEGKLLAGADDYGTLYSWEIPSGRLLYHQKSTEKEYRAFYRPSFTPDGKTLAVMLQNLGSIGPGKIVLLDPATGQRQGFLAVNNIGNQLAISRDSQTVAMQAGMGLRFWDLASQKELFANDQAHECQPMHILVSPRGFLATASYDGSVRIWDAATTKQQRKFAVADFVNDLAVSPDGNLLAAAISWNALHVWETHTGKEIHRLAGHGRQSTLGFLPDGQGLVSFGDDLTLQFWDMKTGAVRLKHAISPQGVDIPAEKDRGERRQVFERNLGNGRFTPDAKTLVLPFENAIHQFNSSTGKQISAFVSENRLVEIPMALSPNGKYLLASCLGDFQVGTHTVYLFDISSGTIAQHLLQQGFRPGAVAFAADGRMFATAVHGPHEEILLYETASGNVRHTIRGFRGQVRSLAFFPDGRRLASGLTDSTVVMWDLTAPEHLAKGP